VRYVFPIKSKGHLVHVVWRVAVDYNFADALGLGTVMGEVVIRGLLKDAGFEDVTVLQPTCFPINQLFIARKH